MSSRLGLLNRCLLFCILILPSIVSWAGTSLKDWVVEYPEDEFEAYLIEDESVYSLPPGATAYWDGIEVDLSNYPASILYLRHIESDKFIFVGTDILTPILLPNTYTDLAFIVWGNAYYTPLKWEDIDGSLINLTPEEFATEIAAKTEISLLTPVTEFPGVNAAAGNPLTSEVVDQRPLRAETDLNYYLLNRYTYSAEALDWLPGSTADVYYIQANEEPRFIFVGTDILTPILLPPNNVDMAYIVVGNNYFDPSYLAFFDPALTNLTAAEFAIIIAAQVGDFSQLTPVDGFPVGEVDPDPEEDPVDPVQPDVQAVSTIGTTAGNFRVDESGSANYAIPIMTASGAAGVVPQISLNYNSQAGNGVVGKGWSIGGLSAVTRCRQTYAQDGKSHGIHFDSEDRFCLDGQRLIEVASGSGYIEYRTEIDSFAVIKAYVGSSGSAENPAYWQVARKDGSISTYGNTDEADDNARLLKSVSPPTSVFSWAIYRFQDSMNQRGSFD